MTNAARDERDRTPYDWTLTGGPEGQALVVEMPPPDPGSDREVTYYTREPDGFGPDDVRWQAITDPAEIATIEGALARGIDPPYEVWVDQAPAALGPGHLTPDVADQTAVYAWEQTGPAVGDGQLYEVTDPVVLTAYEEAHLAQGTIEIITPADFYDAAWAADAARAIDPALYDAQIEALVARGDTWLEVEHAGGDFALGRYDAGLIERDTNGWEPVRVGDGPDDLTGNLYPDEATARQAAVAYNGADLAGTRMDLAGTRMDLAGTRMDLDPTPVAAIDRDLTPALDL